MVGSARLCFPLRSRSSSSRRIPSRCGGARERSIAPLCPACFSPTCLPRWVNEIPGIIQTERRVERGSGSSRDNADTLPPETEYPGQDAAPLSDISPPALLLPRDAPTCHAFYGQTSLATRANSTFTKKRTSLPRTDAPSISSVLGAGVGNFRSRLLVTRHPLKS